MLYVFEFKVYNQSIYVYKNKRTAFSTIIKGCSSWKYMGNGYDLCKKEGCECMLQFRLRYVLTANVYFDIA